MIRRIIQIDKEKCNGCGACASACHEGAIGMVEGKATREFDTPKPHKAHSVLFFCQFFKYYNA